MRMESVDQRIYCQMVLWPNVMKMEISLVVTKEHVIVNQREILNGNATISKQEKMMVMITEVSFFSVF